MIYQLNKYPADRYNVLVPVTTLQAESNLQKITVSEVQLDTRQNYDNKGPSKDIYFEKSSNGYAITKVGGMKLAAAANISIISTTPGRTEGCQRCIEMARATGKPAVCGTCPHTYDVAVTVTIRVPEPSGGFRIMSATKEIDCVLTSQSMTDAQYKRFLPHRTAMAESKAFMRAIRAALGLAGTYNLDDLKKPFIVARIVPNLDAPEIKNAVASSYLQSMGLLFEMPDAKPQIAAPAQPEQVVQPFPDEDGMTPPPQEFPPEPQEPEPQQWQLTPPPAAAQPRQIAPAAQPRTAPLVCADCGQIIQDTPMRNGGTFKAASIAEYSSKAYGRVLCIECQHRANRR